MTNGTIKPHSNFKLTEEAKELLRQMATAQGISMTAVLEIIVRQAAENKRLNAA